MKNRIFKTCVSCLIFASGMACGVAATITANSLDYVITVERRTIAHGEALSLAPLPTEMQDYDDALPSD